MRHLYLARHGAADPFGTLTDTGRQQSALLGARLAHLPISAIWHSPLSRAASTASELAQYLPDASVAEAEELSGQRVADALTDRFATSVHSAASGAELHEVLITHDYPIAWLVRHALGAPPVRWLDLSSANTGLTVITYRTGAAPTVMMFNDLSHLPHELRWTGFPPGLRP